MAPRKLTDKSAAKSAACGVPFAPGYDPRRGRGPKPGAPNAGTPPHAIRLLARQGLVRALPGIIGIALDPAQDPRDRIAAGRLLAEVGLPHQLEDVTPERRPTGEQVVARIRELLPQVLAILPIERQELGRLLAERRRVREIMQGNGSSAEVSVRP